MTTDKLFPTKADDSKSDDTRDRLLQTASQIFADKGFEKATVREICQAAGVSNLAAVNYYFGDKERLYIEAVKLAHRVKVAEIPLPQWDADTPPEAKLHGFILTMLSRMMGESCQPWHEQLMMREVTKPTAAVVELVQEFIRPHFELLLAILDELLPADVPAERRHQIGFSVIGQCLHYRVAMPIVELLIGSEELATYTPSELATHITQFTLGAIRGLTNPSLSGKPRKNAVKGVAP